MHYSTTPGPRKINLNTDNSCDEGGNWEMNFATSSANQTTCGGILNVSKIANPPCTPTNGVSKNDNYYSSFLVFPNPTESKLNIERNSSNGNPINILILDISGKIITNNTYFESPSNITLDLSNFYVGMYILKIQDIESGIIETFKISKQ